MMRAFLLGLKSTFPSSHSFFNIFKDSLVAPFIEEPVKISCCLSNIFYASEKYKVYTKLLGWAMAGTGFEIRGAVHLLLKI